MPSFLIVIVLWGAATGWAQEAVPNPSQAPPAPSAPPAVAPSYPFFHILMPKVPVASSAWKLAPIETLLDQSNASDDGWNAALGHLQEFGIFAAIQAQVRALKETDPTRLARLRQVRERLLSNLERTADEVFLAAKSLATVGSNAGPLAESFGTVQLSRQRLHAKVLSCFLVDPITYSGEIADPHFYESDSTTFIDCGMAAGLFQFAAKCYDHAALQVHDSKSQQQDHQKAASARREARKARGDE
jgi:hypothetical protein